MTRSFDATHGGFGGAPKFPHPMDLRLLLRIAKRDPKSKAVAMATLTLDKMAGGGMYDQLGGGFHRYSVDAKWLVPHFEKMLYDNALLTAAYTEAWQATGNPEYARVVRETLDYVTREMTGPEGGFYSTQDADSEGEEGKFYVWTPAEIGRVLGAERAKTFAFCYDVTDDGNFEGQNILNLPKSIAECAKSLGRDEAELRKELGEARKELFEVRKQRVHPGLDDKILTSWNGLMIGAMAGAGAALGVGEYVRTAAKSADFILTKLRRPDGRLLHSYRHGQAKFDGYLDDYASLADALVTLYEADGDARWIEEAVATADRMIKHFADAEAGGFYYTADDHEELIARNKDVYDNATPSGTGLAATALVRLGKLCGRQDYLAVAERTFQTIGELLGRAPTAVSQSLLALDMYVGPTQELVLAAGDDAARSLGLSEIRRRFWPGKVVAHVPGRGQSKHLEAVTAGKTPPAEVPRLYVCENFTCQKPVDGLEAIAAECDKYAPAAR
jgi:uncharacterized protein YyaL (SSP411 family)